MPHATISQELVDILAPILLAIVSWAVVELTRWLRLHTAVADSRWANEVLIRVEAEALSLVRELDQTVVPAIRSGARDGRFSSTEIAELRELALSKLRVRLRPKELARLVDTGQLEAYLKGKIEAALTEHKIQLAGSDAAEPPDLHVPANKGAIQ